MVDRIKSLLPDNADVHTKSDIDEYLLEHLISNFEEARENLVINIKTKKEAEEKRRIEQEKQKAEQERIRKEKRAAMNANFKMGLKFSAFITAGIVAVVIVVSLIFLFVNNVIMPANRYNDAVELMENEEWLKAKDILLSLDDYKDSEDLLEQCNNEILADKYENAQRLINNGKYSEALQILEEITDYKDSEALIKQCRDALQEEDYNNAIQLMENGEYEKAISEFSKLSGYKDSSSLIKECENGILEQKYLAAIELMNKADYENAIIAFEELSDYKNASSLITQCKEKINESQYNEAVKLANKGAYEEAITIFKSLGNYKDSADLCQKYSLLICDVGDIVTFGSYEQDNNLNNGKEQIEWIVLDRKDDKVLVISKYCLDSAPFNEVKKQIKWENCSLRKWLNGTFINSAFSTEEQAKISISSVKNPDYGDGDSTAYSNTIDKVFLLSDNEATLYFKSDSERKASATAYSKSKECHGYWWLRSSNSTEFASYVSYDGKIYGEWVDYESWAVRPAIWIEIS